MASAADLPVELVIIIIIVVITITLAGHVRLLVSEEAEQSGAELQCNAAGAFNLFSLLFP